MSFVAFTVSQSQSRTRLNFKDFLPKWSPPKPQSSKEIIRRMKSIAAIVGGKK